MKKGKGCNTPLPKIDIECGQVKETTPNERKERMIKNPYWLRHQAKKSQN